MSVARRRFLKKGSFALITLSLLPPSISFLRDEDQLTINEIFAQLSFKKGTFSSTYLNDHFKLPAMDEQQISRNGSAYYSKNVFCIEEQDMDSPDSKGNFFSFYKNSVNGYKKVLSLSSMELKSFSGVLSYLKKEQNITDPEELRGWLIPTFKTGKHLASNNRVDGDCTSQHGYYTARGYCSMQIKAKGNSYRIQTKLLNFRKIRTFQNSYKLQDLV